jgi:mycoredoxin
MTRTHRESVDCSQVMLELQAFLDGELDSERAALVASHLETCLNCDLESETVQSVIDAIRDVRDECDSAACRRLADTVERLAVARDSRNGDGQFQEVTVYWRPGCVFCHGLLRGLQRAGLAFEQRNIWEDGEAAAFVRSVAGGNETVPTVRVQQVALINPTAVQVLREVATRAPEQLPDGYEPPPVGPIARLWARLRRV